MINRSYSPLAPLLLQKQRRQTLTILFFLSLIFFILPVPAELRRLFQHVIEVSNGSTCNMYLFFLLFPICN
jgi:hypothetical protein